MLAVPVPQQALPPLAVAIPLLQFEALSLHGADATNDEAPVPVLRLIYELFSGAAASAPHLSAARTDGSPFGLCGWRCAVARGGGTEGKEEGRRGRLGMGAQNKVDNGPELTLPRSLFGSGQGQAAKGRGPGLRPIWGRAK